MKEKDENERKIGYFNQSIEKRKRKT